MEKLLAQKWFWVVLVTILLLPFMLKRKITAMKCNSRILFFGISCLLLTFFIKQFETIAPPKADFEFKFENLVNSINVTLTTYGFIVNLFPVTSAMKNSSYSNVMKAVALALFFCFATYITISLLCLRIYGSEININLFENLM